MSRILLTCTMVWLIFGGAVFVGCQSKGDKLPSGENGSTAGGNGAFGESTSRPGQYDSGNTNHPAPADQR